MKKYLLHFSDTSWCTAIGLLVLRIGVSASLMTHGYGKLMNYESLSTKFMSHLFLSSEFTLSLVIFAELFFFGTKPKKVNLLTSSPDN